MEVFKEGFLVAFKGVPMTLQVTVMAVIFGIFLGFFIALMKMSKNILLRGIAGVYVEIVRGTPLIVQALIMAYGIPTILQAYGSEFKWANLIIPAVCVCALNSAAYVAEVIRGGLQSVDRGQMEAASSLGMSKFMALRLIIIPQAFKIIMPSLGNEFITLIKETSVLAFCGVPEILRQGELWASSNFNTFEAYTGVALAYMCLTIPLSRIVKLIEKRMKRNERKA